MVYCVDREGGRGPVSPAAGALLHLGSRDRPNAGESLIVGSWRPVESPSAYRLKHCGTPHANLSFPSFSSPSSCPLTLESAWRDGRWAGYLQRWLGGSLLEDAGWHRAYPFPVVEVVVRAMPTNKMAMLAMQDSIAMQCITELSPSYKAQECLWAHMGDSLACLHSQPTSWMCNLHSLSLLPWTSHIETWGRRSAPTLHLWFLMSAGNMNRN